MNKKKINMFKVKIFLGVLGCVLSLASIAFSGGINEDKVSSAVMEAGKYLQKQQFAKVVELLENDLPLSLTGNESHDFVGVYGIGYNNLGHAYLQLGQYDKAIEAFKKARDVLGKWSAPYYLLGQAYFRKNDPEKNLAYFNKGLELEPEKVAPEDYVYAFLSYISLNDQDKAKSIMEQAKKRFPQIDVGPGHSSKGWKYLDSKEIDKAIEEFETSLKYPVFGPGAYSGLYTAYARKGNIPQAKVYLDKGLQLFPDDAWINLSAGQYYLYVDKDSKKAIFHLEKYKALMPEFSQKADELIVKAKELGKEIGTHPIKE
ncbi:MAG: tetratricopeptide repeat protein [Candidatus Omnitrophica bacterium]|nr:tetratricopeptide repeat protein [Candidatus Omnitrophota bacterium]